MKIIEGICSICLEKYKCAIDFVPPKRTTFRQKLKAFLNSSEKNAIGMLECGHMFHTACVEEWIQPKIVRETITVQDQSYDPIAGALVAVQRWNVGTNTYSTIGMLTTSSAGQGIVDLELYTTWYRAAVSIDGSIVEITDVQKLSSTSWIITVQRGEDNPYDLFGSISVIVKCLASV